MKIKNLCSNCGREYNDTLLGYAPIGFRFWSKCPHCGDYGLHKIIDSNLVTKS